MLNQLKRRQLTNALPRKEADTGNITVSIFVCFTCIYKRGTGYNFLRYKQSLI